MALRLIRDLPGDEFLLPPSPHGLKVSRARLGRLTPPRGLASATDARTTRLHRPRQCRSSRALRTAHELLRPAITSKRTRHHRVHRIPRSTFVTIAIRPSVVEAGWRELTTDFGKTEALFLPKHLDNGISLEL